MFDSWRKKRKTVRLWCKFWKFLLLPVVVPFRVSIVYHLPQSHSIPDILLCHTSSFTTFMMLLWGVPGFLHPGSSISTVLCLMYSSVCAIPPLHMLRPSQPRLSNCVSKLLNLSCPSDECFCYIIPAIDRAMEGNSNPIGCQSRVFGKCEMDQKHWLYLQK